MASRKTILLAPLDWGMGHTTRCVPVMRHLQATGHHIAFCGNEWQRQYIEKTFNDIDTYHLDGYNIHYGEGSFLASMLPQVPQILKAIKEENKWLADIVEKIKPDGIISDNRYGLHHDSVPSVIMTHQLAIQSGMGSIMDASVRKAIYPFLNKFNAQWVVDMAGENNLSGKLGHPNSMPDNAAYIGLLSQLERTEIVNTEKYLLVLLSGPEPQRTVLEEILWEQVKGYNGKVVFVSGAEEVSVPDDVPPHISHYKRITSATLLPLMQEANMVICRSGYSSLMDLVLLYKKAILIPTPGQTEQEYLAKHLSREGMFYTMPQKNFNLEKALQDAATCPFEQPILQDAFEVYRNVVDAWLDQL